MRLSAPRLACLLVASAIAAPCAQQPADGSVERIRAALAKPPSRLTLTERPPDFTVHIEERRPLQEIFEVPPWASPTLFFGGHTRPAPFAPIEGVPGGFSAPAGGMGMNMLAMLGQARSLAESGMHALRVQSAHREVQRTLAEYCAAQPNAGAAIQVCSTFPAIQ